ncbi:hypothetical protein CYLTODRAFT_196202 [Cylindrobasidium torrendii FP15055 ss-10]|uniref:Uncharacterized protein n=1 Tax=Cylindrobasidium torrendii FP15055 ss-10 TaxID=1314674 RepID=A0A0D7BIC4_9AGAR|nr:hypothetical protein CYLTODRAFT_196202 [Cylindrobasidium torrendii FP15055 ss-10]
MERPSTSKSRGTCKYYKDPRGCFAGGKCKFKHAEPDVEALTPYDQAKTCRFYVQGYCKRGESCWFKHSLPKSTGSAAEDDEPEPCSICFDTPTTYGLLVSCSHVFCIKCIKEWRESARKNNEENMMKVTKQCPMCRAESKYVMPSSIPFRNGDSRKESALATYKESMAKVRCRHFERSKKDPTMTTFCPFGKDCFYQHLNDDGTPYIFADGVDVNMRA